MTAETKTSFKGYYRIGAQNAVFIAQLHPVRRRRGSGERQAARHRPGIRRPS
ncbi:hypothetical protein ACVOMV_23610 [Mesorhizobium atlanticum]